jgi:hypothetical protein
MELENFENEIFLQIINKNLNKMVNCKNNLKFFFLKTFSKSIPQKVGT